MGGGVLILLLAMASYAFSIETFAEKYWEEVRCQDYFYPDECDFSQIPLLTVDDFERCGPARVPYLYGRNYYLGTSGKGSTYKENIEAYQRIRIKPRAAREIRASSLQVTTLGQRMNFPIGISPSAMHKLAHPDGELATVAGAASKGMLMVLSSLSTVSLEEVSAVSRGSGIHLWMQVYVLKDNKTAAVDIVRRAERSGYEAIVMTLDRNIAATLTCDAGRERSLGNTQVPNYGQTFATAEVGVVTFEDITWMTTVTKLPIVAKGILRADDAQRAVMAGASAILVSNHGGRQVDSSLATIDALPDVVSTVKRNFPQVDVYVDGGIRSGQDVFKAIARGAKMAFIGRPAIWGIAMGGAVGLRTVLDILTNEFNDTMLLAGARNPYEITSDSILSPSCKRTFD